MVNIITTKSEHTQKVCSLYENAIAYFKKNNINQWQNGYPCLASLLQDMAKGESYVVVKDEKIVASFMLSQDKEPTYDEIYEGEWLCALPCGVIHRVVVSDDVKGQGIMSHIVAFAAKQCPEQGSLRCDTHKDNLSMQKALSKNGFCYCGVIYLDKEKQDCRIAYEKLL